MNGLYVHVQYLALLAHQRAAVTHQSCVSGYRDKIFLWVHTYIMTLNFLPSWTSKA